MKILGIDYGEKRIGLAISDETQTFARELDILSPKEFFTQIHSIITEHQISKVVLGWPVNMSGRQTKKTQEVKKFKEKLESVASIPVATTDERLTSKMAETISGNIRLRQGFGGLRSKNKLKSAKNIDSLAAQIILQNYLDKNKTRGG